MSRKKVIISLITMVVGFSLLGWLFEYIVFYGIAALVALTGLVSQTAGEWLVIHWLRFGEWLGMVNGKILLTVIYFLILTPIALLKRLVSKKPKDTWFERHHEYSEGDISTPF